MVDGLGVADPHATPGDDHCLALAHMGIQTLGIRASALFGDGSLTVDTVRWPRTASEGLRALATHYEHWRRGARTHQPADEDAFTTLILHMNRELIHYGAEVGLMRDLYRSGRRVQTASA